MYGLINASFESMVLANFGVKIWEAITSTNWVRYEYYPDDWTYELITKTSKETNVGESELLEMYGKYTLHHLKDEGYDNLLRCLGVDLLSWLSNVNALHENISSALPKLVPPEIRCEETAADELTLHYKSPQGARFAPAVQGLVTEAAKEYFGCDVRMDRIETQGVNGALYTTWSIKQIGVVPMVPDIHKSKSQLHRLKLREELGVEQSGRDSNRYSGRQGLHSGRQSSYYSGRNSGRNSYQPYRNLSDRYMSDTSSHTNTSNSSAVLYSSIWRQAIEESNRARLFLRQSSDYAESSQAPNTPTQALSSAVPTPSLRSKRSFSRSLSSVFSCMSCADQVKVAAAENIQIPSLDVPHSISSSQSRLASRRSNRKSTGYSFGLSGMQLNEVFPYHIVFNRELIILQTGHLLEDYTGSDLKRLSIDRLFTLQKPQTSWTNWTDFVASVRGNGQSLELQSNISHLKLVGQLLFSRDDCVATFLCTPNVSNLADMTHQGVTVNDLSKHDCRLKMILASEHIHSETESGYRLATMSRQLEREREVSMMLIKESAEQAENMLATKKAFVRHVSHEIRTPLTVAKLGLDLLEKDFDSSEVSDENRNNVTDCQEAIDIAVTIVNDLLSYEKLESGILELYCDMLPVVPFIEKAMGPFSLQAKQKNISFEICADTLSGDIFFDVDSHKMSQVLRNLASNALKFTPSGGSVSVSVTHNESSLNGGIADKSVKSIDKYCPFGRVRIEFTDTGVGISRENQEKVFKEIVQFSPDVLQDGGGSGLGLWISHGIVALHGGVIGVESEGEGSGSTFYVELSTYQPTTRPTKIFGSKLSLRRQMSEEESFTEAQTEVSFCDDPENSVNSKRFFFRRRSSPSIASGQCAPSELNGLRVLVADDAVMIRKVVKRVLESRGALCETAEDGNIVLKKVCELNNIEESDVNGSKEVPVQLLKCYDIILMDYIMPHTDGPTCTNLLRKAGYDGLIIGATGNVMPDDIKIFEDAGVNSVLPKPLRIEDVENCVARFRTSNLQEQ